jgi:prepilin-type N-terminal cleavage/methylation domain-containing protein
LTGAARRGFTLIEMVLCLVITLVVTGAVYRVLLATQRLARAQADQLSLQSSVRGASLALVNELRELAGVEGGSAAENDIMRIAPNAITYRAMRGFGFACQPPSGTQIRLGRRGFSGYRDPQAGRDSVYVYVSPREAQSGGDTGWVALAITNVSLTAPCPGTGEPGISLTLQGVTSLGGFAAGTPVRIYEIVELALYRSDGKSWLGTRSVSTSEAIQPLFGPLTPSDGFRLDYLDATGMPTAALSAIKSIRITVRGLSEGTMWPGIDGEPANEELITQVAMRNALR